MWRVVSLLLMGLLVISVLVAGALRPAPVETVSFFNRRCSACHGKDGAMFKARFEKKYPTAADLEQIVEAMPGASTLNKEGVRAMVAYMRAISRGEAYVVWTEARSGVLEGEISPPNARLTATARRQPLKVERISGNRWRIRLPEGVKPADVELRARNGAKRTTLRLKNAPYSHTR